MSNQWFRFKKFSIQQDRCAMKVGTDGVLLGAWSYVPVSGQVLDVGTGTGLLSMMLAQRSAGVRLTGLEIDKEAFSQAVENIAASRYADRIDIIHGDFNEYASSFPGDYELVICNPPYFVDSFKPGQDQRSLARHADSLSLAGLIERASGLLTASGRLSIIIPAVMEEEANQQAFAVGLNLHRALDVISVPGRPPKRCCLEFTIPREKPTREKLVIEEGGRHQYSEAYKALTREFYLDF